VIVSANTAYDVEVPSGGFVTISWNPQ
jgi:hypothetical protein